MRSSHNISVAVLCQRTNMLVFFGLTTVAACCSQEQGAHASRGLADVDVLDVLSAVHAAVYIRVVLMTCCVKEA